MPEYKALFFRGGWSYVCEDCGSYVYDKEKHDEWHEECLLEESVRFASNLMK